MSVNGFDFDGIVHRYNYNSLDNIPPNIAPAYSASSTYAVGDYCTKDNVLYKCSTTISTAEAWNSAHWTQVQLATDVADIKDDLSHIEPGLSDDAKQALLNCFAHVTWDDDDGPDYREALYNALYTDGYPRITATFIQGNNIIYATDSLDSLKPYLTVTYYESAESTGTIVQDYTLSGDLSNATSTITALYVGKTASFTVSVTMPSFEYLSSSGKLLSEIEGVVTDHSSVNTATETLVDSHLRLFAPPTTDYSNPIFLQRRLPIVTMTKGMMRVKFNLLQCINSVTITANMRLRISNGSSGVGVGQSKDGDKFKINYGSGSSALQSTSTFTMNEWHVIEMYFDSSKQTIKVDGTQIVNLQSLATSYVTNNSIFVQNANTSGNVEFYVDEIQIYDLSEVA